MANDKIYKIIYLIDQDGDYVWCDDPAPSPDMDEKDAIAYIRLDIAKDAIRTCIKYPMGVEPYIATEVLNPHTTTT